MTAEYNLSVLDFRSGSQATAALHPSPLSGSSSTVFQSFLESFVAHLCSHAGKTRLVNLQHSLVHSSALIWTVFALLKPNPAPMPNTKIALVCIPLLSLVFTPSLSLVILLAFFKATDKTSFQ